MIGKMYLCKSSLCILSSFWHLLLPITQFWHYFFFMICILRVTNKNEIWILNIHGELQEPLSFSTYMENCRTHFLSPHTWRIAGTTFFLHIHGELPEPLSLSTYMENCRTHFLQNLENLAPWLLSLILIYHCIAKLGENKGFH